MILEKTELCKNRSFKLALFRLAVSTFNNVWALPFVIGSFFLKKYCNAIHFTLVIVEQPWFDLEYACTNSMHKQGV